MKPLKGLNPSINDYERKLKELNWRQWTLSDTSLFVVLGIYNTHLIWPFMHQPFSWFLEKH